MLSLVQFQKMEAFNNRTGPGGDLEQQNYESEDFFYFAYGSNLLRERIMLRNPSVVFLTIAQLLVCTVFDSFLS